MPRCCNPHHLFLGTDQDNVDDAISKGRKRPRLTEKRPAKSRREPRFCPKLTRAQAVAIRQSTDTKAAIARKYGVSSVMIGRIKNNLSWTHV
jgi:hypothetical protein